MNSDSRHQPANPTPITDSPFFWVYLFSTFGLIILLVMMPKLEMRQRDFELKARGKRESMRELQDSTSPGQPNSQHSTENPRGFSPEQRLRMLIGVMGGILVVSWTAYWVTRYRATSQAHQDATPRSTLSTDTSFSTQHANSESQAKKENRE